MFNGEDEISFNCQGHTISGDGDSDGYGIWLRDIGDGSRSNTIRNCANISYFNHGANLEHESYYTKLTNTSLILNNNDGMHVYRAESSIFTDLTLSENGRYGAYIHSGYSTFSGITSNDNGEDGFHLVDTDSTRFTDITSSNNMNGFYLRYYSEYNTFTDITTSDNVENGIYIYNSTSNNITNLISRNNGEYGIVLYRNSDYTTINNSRIENNTLAGI
ncbi:MAG: right-handed parallel beta-helix repeat-containing protein, partial [Candidatus Thorarchaeota archaeon]